MTQLAAFIPLKGHSARVPGKNMRLFRGRPLFHSIVETLHATKGVGPVYIDTDSDEIAASAADLGGVTIRHRKAELIGDDVSVNLLIDDFLRDEPDAQHFVQTHSTNPLLRPSTVDAAIDRYFATDATSLFSVTRIQARVYTERMEAVNHDPTELIPTQDLEPVYLENSNFYICQRDAFFESGRRITSQAEMFEMDGLEAVDIDEEADFRLAELLAESSR